MTISGAEHLNGAFPKPASAVSRERGPVILHTPDSSRSTQPRHIFGALLALLAILTAAAGVRRWQQVDRAMRRGVPLPRQRVPVYVGVGLIVLGVLTLGLVFLKAVTG